MREIREELLILKITVEELESNSEVEVLIKCQHVDEKVEKLISAIQLNSKTILGKSEGSTYILTIEDILYFDTVDEKVFIYTKEKVYETSLRLYEIEGMLEDTGVIRVNKSTILNLMKVDHVLPMLNGRIKATLLSGESIIISRQYVQNFKKKLGI
jgi:DNA-binding LytR/AlgR family response regulator